MGLFPESFWKALPCCRRVPRPCGYVLGSHCSLLPPPQPGKGQMLNGWISIPSL